MQQQPSWAKTQLKIILNRMEMIKMMTSMCIRHRGGDANVQKSAELAATIALVNGESPQSAVQTGIISGMMIMRFNGKKNA